MPYKDPIKQKIYLMLYDAKRNGRKNYANLTPEEVERFREYERERRRRLEREYRKRVGRDFQGYLSYSWVWRLKREFGLTPEEFHQMLKRQKGRCAACRKKFAGLSGSRSDRLAVDHCHETNQVRGLLCGSCNRTVGHAQEDSRRLRACADYLDSFPV